jgi:dTDP-4-amino-4,6-dideoxy-D-galactose acyltransferase
MSRSAPDTCERLPWDSGFFGVSIARVTRTRATAGDLASAVRWAGHSSIDCLYFLADADHHESVRAAEENGFSLVDVRVTLERSVAPGATADDDADVRLATLDDLPRLASIARTSHRNTRFHRDRHFDARRADEMYAVWIERAVRGELADAVWVIDRGDGPLGYLAASRDGACSSIGLVAIDAACRGAGYGRRLVATALRWAAGQALTRVSVVTQGHDAAALRFYESSGLTARRVQLWYHYWSRRPSTAGSQ